MFGISSVKPAAIKSHIEAHVGPISKTDQTRLKGLKLVTAEDSQAGLKRLVTVGHSAKPMVSEEDGKKAKYWVELFVSFRKECPDWAPDVLTHLVEMSLARPQNWVFGDSCLVDAGEWYPGCPYKGFLLAASSSARDEFSIATLGKKKVLFLTGVPLYAEEVDYKLAHSTLDLLKLMDRFPIEESVEERVNCRRPEAQAVEGGIAAAILSLENQNSPLAIKHLAQVAQGLEQLGLLPRAAAIYQLAQEMGANATAALSRLAEAGAEVDGEYLGEVRRRLQGFDFPPLNAEEHQRGVEAVDRMETLAQHVVAKLLDMDPASLSSENAKELLYLRAQVESVGRANWIRLSGVAAVYFVLRVGTDFARLQVPEPWWSENAESALQAALEAGDDRSQELASLKKHLARTSESPAAAMNPHPWNALCALVSWWVWCRLRQPDKSAPFPDLEVFRTPEVKANAETLVIFYQSAIQRG